MRAVYGNAKGKIPNCKPGVHAQRRGSARMCRELLDVTSRWRRSEIWRSSTRQEGSSSDHQKVAENENCISTPHSTIRFLFRPLPPPLISSIPFTMFALRNFSRSVPRSAARLSAKAFRPQASLFRPVVAFQPSCSHAVPRLTASFHISVARRQESDSRTIPRKNVDANANVSQHNRSSSPSSRVRSPWSRTRARMQICPPILRNTSRTAPLRYHLLSDLRAWMNANLNRSKTSLAIRKLPSLAHSAMKRSASPSPRPILTIPCLTTK